MAAGKLAKSTSTSLHKAGFEGIVLVGRLRAGPAGPRCYQQVIAVAVVGDLAAEGGIFRD
jgi:hypothetical protein